MDAFAVSIGVSLRLGGISHRQSFRLALHFGLFQFLMPCGGWLLSRSIQSYIQAVDHWIAFFLLLLIGGRMVRDSFNHEDKAMKKRSDPTKGVTLLVLAIATSIDAFAAGLSLGLLNTKVLYPALVIGIVAFILSLTGSRLGPILGKIIGKRAELIGGVVLILIGSKILFDHLS
jgi:putative Mn2+ efflux pump MntP